MNAITPILPAEVAADPSIARAEARLRDLEEVRAACMCALRRGRDRILALDEEPEDEVLGETDQTATVEAAGRTIDRMARSVRLTIMLEERLEKIVRDLKAGRVSASVEGVARRRRDAVERVMMTAIRERHAGFDSKIERDREYLREHLGREDFAARPVSETVRRLCDMLGLRVDWKRWADEDWAEEEAEGPGSPFRVAAEPSPDSS